MDNFGEFVKTKRLERGLGLREFCQRVPIDPSNFSKVERGKLEPPLPGTAQFTAICAALDVTPGSADAQELERLASVERGMIPRSVLSNEQVAAKLPAFFRTLDGNPISEEERQELIRVLLDA